MNNAEIFAQTFGIYATEMWAMPESEFLSWLNSLHDVNTTNTTDSISRQDALDTVTRYCNQYDLRELLADIEVLPSAEPQIIRCKDCKHFQIDGNFMFCNSEGSMFADVTENDFCSYAERREEE